MSLINRMRGVPPASMFVAGVLLLLVGLSPIAMSYGLPAALSRDGGGVEAYVHDETYPARVALIVLGLLGSATAAVATCISGWKDHGHPTVIVNASMLSACIALGWCLYPYWANGVYEAYSGNLSFRDLDPAYLPPMIWIGELLRLTTLLLWPIGMVTQLGALVGALWISGRASYRTSWVWVVCAAALLHLLSVLLLSPGFVSWVLD